MEDDDDELTGPLPGSSEGARPEHVLNRLLPALALGDSPVVETKVKPRRRRKGFHPALEG